MMSHMIWIKNVAFLACMHFFVQPLYKIAGHVHSVTKPLPFANRIIYGFQLFIATILNTLPMNAKNPPGSLSVDP